MQGACHLGDDIAVYVDEGGCVCTLGPLNASNCAYTIKGRWGDQK